MPWNSLPNSFAKLGTHILLYLSDLMRCRYLTTAPMKCSGVFSVECCSLCWSRCAARAYPCRCTGAFVIGGGSCASVRMCSAMTQFIRCEVRAWRRVCVVLVEGVCARGGRQRIVGGTMLLKESSSMMAGRFRRLSGGLAGELGPVAGMGCWTSLGLHISTGSLSMMGRGAGIGGGVGALGGTSPRRSVRRAWIAASSSGGDSCTRSIAAVRRAVASRILSVAVIVGTGRAW